MVRKIGSTRAVTGVSTRRISAAQQDLPQNPLGNSQDEDSDSGSDSEMFQLGAKALELMKTPTEAMHVDKVPAETPLFFVDKEAGTNNAASKPSQQVIPLSPQSGSMKKKRKKKSRSGIQLSSSLQVDIEKNLYVNSGGIKAISCNTILPFVNSSEDIMKTSVLTGEAEKRDTLPPYEESLNQLKKKRREERDKTKGKGWFHMPATELTEEKKNDLMILQYRKALDPKRFYKAPDIRSIPKYFQMGTVVDNPVDFYHSRIPKKQRKKTLVEELLEDSEFRQYNKRKYAEIQDSKRKGKGAYRHMKRMKKKKK